MPLEIYQFAVGVAGIMMGVLLLRTLMHFVMEKDVDSSLMIASWLLFVIAVTVSLIKVLL